MAKGKGKTDSPEEQKYSDDEIADFVAALEGDGDQPEPVEKVKSTATGRKIRVQTESDETATKHRPVSAGSKPGEHIDTVLGQQPSEDMGRLTKTKRPGFRWGILIGIVVLLAAASLGGFFFFNRAKKFTNTHVQLQFPTITSATSGSTLSVVVEYQNLEPVDLLNAEMTVEYPEGFTYLESQPAAGEEFHNDFKLGTIRSGQAGKVTITGTIVGAIGEVRGFAATLSYRPSTFNSDFQQKATTEVKITSSILGLTLAGPTQLAPGASGTWTVTYKNTSDRDLPAVQIAATYPESMTVSSTTPAAQEQKNQWRLSGVKKGAEGSITIVGTIDGNIGDTFTLKVGAGLVTTANTVQPQDEQSLLIILVKTGVQTAVAVNGSTDPQVVQPGDSINYSIRVTNSSDIEVTTAVVTVKLEGAALDQTALVVDGQGKFANGVITWTKDQVEGLANLKPGKSLTLTFGSKVVSPLSVKQDADRDPHITATVNVASPTLTTNSNTSAPSTVVITKVATILKLDAEARYYDEQGAPLGSGPVPPQVGKTTSYRISWTVTNTTNDAETMVVSARLPNSVLWTGKNLTRDAGDLTFDPETRLVTWTLNVLPAGTGGRLPALTARFEVAITPTTEQVGTVPVLIETATATATDAYTKKSLTSSASSLSTDVPSDAQAGGEGRVVSGT